MDAGRSRDPREILDRLRQMAQEATSAEEARQISTRIARIMRQYQIKFGIGVPDGPLEQALELEPTYEARPHLEYLSQRISQAVADVEAGQNRMLAISMPPRAGKSTLVSTYTPLWALRKNPAWKIITASYDGLLTSTWAGTIREKIERHPALGIALKEDGGAKGRWITEEGGGMYATSVGGNVTGRGANFLLIDDPIKDFVEAHSEKIRQSMWDWWLTVAQLRLEAPFLVAVVMTRWHEDDFVGRLLSEEHEGDPRDWEVISLPALGESGGDALGREEGDPLYLPFLEETPNEARARWEHVKQSVGTYSFSAMYQQRPAPAEGAIFDMSWWRYWTTDPSRATDDGKVVFIDPQEFANGKWIDSWDMAFRGAETNSDFVVGQRWVRHKANRYLMHQTRSRRTFTQSLAEMRRWNTDEVPYTHFVHRRLVEAKANGDAIIDTLRDEISGLHPVNPTASKEARARAITPEVESGNVYFPHPSEKPWVNDLLEELRNFPNDTHDDQVDALTQALNDLRDQGKGRISSPIGRGPGAVATGAQRRQRRGIYVPGR